MSAGPLRGVAEELRRVDGAIRLPRYRGRARIVVCCEVDDYAAPRGVDVYSGARVVFSSLCATGLGGGSLREGVAYLVDGEGLSVAPMLGAGALPLAELVRLLASAGRLRPRTLARLRRRLLLEAA